jgi:nifR3 family TIM-barrel protein
MAGVNDPIFRAICKQHGADLTYTEMVSAKGLSYGNQRTSDMLYIHPQEQPAAVQLFGHEPATLAEQCKAVEQELGEQVALIDLNMGCPARKVAGKGDGAALLKDLPLALQILEAMVKATSLPVTAKIRIGYEANGNTAIEFAKSAQGVGIQAITLHGRTAAQMYKGKANRQIIAELKAAVDIPVIASGDVFTSADINEYLNTYHADAVMVARGAQGNPWIFAQAKGTMSTAPTLSQRIEVARQHTQKLAALNPHKLASMRKHISWYFKGTPNATKIRQKVNTCITLTDYEHLLNELQ